MQKIVAKSTALEHLATETEVSFHHTLAETGMFEDNALADLIDVARQKGPAYYTLGSLDENGYGDKWQTGVIGDLNGKDVLEAVRQGHLWLQLQSIKEISPDHFALAAKAFAELKEIDPGFSYHNLMANVLISSPSARVLCHLDCAQVVLWHIRGRKRIYLYDLNRYPFADEKTIEKVIMRETEEEIPYKSEWDAQARVYDLEPGQAVNWPHFWPHRIDNLEGLNVSMQTEFYSDNGLRRYGVRFANGLLRRKFGIQPKSTSITGPLALAKTGIGLVSKKLGLQKASERKIPSLFTIDPNRPGATLKLQPEMQNILQK